MSGRLPVHLDPLSLAERGRVIEGSVPIAAFKRLAPSLHRDRGDIAVTLRFERDTGGRHVLHGELDGQLELVCQRCLTPFALPIGRTFDVVLVESLAAADLLPEELEPLVVDERRSMHTVDLLEDELILALPIVPRCGDGGPGCETAVEVLASEDLGG
ncbi:MAG: YceD family protein [Halofilum sp. (in: g-proteobacteria)]|nr:YceD family protein [Halofilum sp. (in: g-proteobacteria)]